MKAITHKCTFLYDILFYEFIQQEDFEYDFLKNQNSGQWTLKFIKLRVHSQIKWNFSGHVHVLCLDWWFANICFIRVLSRNRIILLYQIDRIWDIFKITFFEKNNACNWLALYKIWYSIGDI